MTTPRVGQGAEIAIEANPVVAGTFVVVAELRGDPSFPTSRASADATSHDKTLGEMLVSPVLDLQPISFEGNFLYDNATHDSTDGLEKHMHTNTLFGMRWRGPSGAADTDEIICSGRLTSFERIARSGPNPYGFSATFQPIGSSGLKVEGATVTGAA